MNRPDYHQLAQKIQGVIVALGYAVDDVERGHYDAGERERLAGYLDNVAAALRCTDATSGLVIDQASSNLAIEPSRNDG